MCPANFQPYLDNQSLDCTGLCCMPASSDYTCNVSTSANCVVPEVCTGCWAAMTDTDLTCEEGRVCCYNSCD